MKNITKLKKCKYIISYKINKQIEQKKLIKILKIILL